MLNRIKSPRIRHPQAEKGQSLVLLALMFVGLLAFMGLAIDVGFIYVRQAQLTAAVDAAALAGVSELTSPGMLPVANLRAAEFMHAHNLPSVVITRTFANPDNYSEGLSVLGARQYSITATWPVDLFFLRVIGRDTFSVTKSATAAQFPLADIYASRRVEDGALSTSNQAIFGPHICVTYGDPFSSFSSAAAQFRQTWRGDSTDRTYHYRILIPPEYSSDIVRVELFDPDSINRPNNNGGSYQDQVVHTSLAIANGMPPTETRSCSSDQKNPCLINTGEGSLGFPVDRINLWWFARIDENRGSGTAPGNPNVCGEPSSYTVGFNTVTLYSLFYYQRLADGTIVETPLAWYYGQSGQSSRDNAYSSFNHQTDMQWVSPGGRSIFDQPVAVPAGCGSPNGGDYDAVSCPGGTPPGPGNGFELSINDDLANILVDGVTGNRYVYLDVTSLSGASENGFEIWAGPPDYVNNISSNVNTRNVQIINNPNAHSSRGATVFGMGHLPMNSNVNFAVDIPLVYLGPEYAGTSVYLSHYDSDSGAQPPIIFYFDSIAESDWSKTFGNGGVDPDGVSGRCRPGNCNGQFVAPPYRIAVPTFSEDCTNPADPSQRDICTPFYGGRLIARYIGGTNDTYHWNITLDGLPYLVR